MGDFFHEFSTLSAPVRVCAEQVLVVVLAIRRLEAQQVEVDEDEQRRRQCYWRHMFLAVLDFRACGWRPRSRGTVNKNAIPYDIM